jgi:uncharacterized protein (DUF1778 family)
MDVMTDDAGPAPKKRRRGGVPKPEEAKKTSQIRIRVTASQKAILSAAADKAGLGISSWLLTVGLREAEARASDK